MLRRYRLALVLLLTPILSAHAAQQVNTHCPAVDQIKPLPHGLYLAQTLEGDWTGISQNSRGQRIDRFKEALVRLDSDSANSGHFDGCRYQIDGVDANIRLNMAGVGGARIADADLSAWEEIEGPFGSAYLLCQSTDPTQCRMQLR